MEFVTKWREDRPDENKSRYVIQICYTDILVSDQWFIPQVVGLATRHPSGNGHVAAAFNDLRQLSLSKALLRQI